MIFLQGFFPLRCYIYLSFPTSLVRVSVWQSFFNLIIVSGSPVWFEALKTRVSEHKHKSLASSTSVFPCTGLGSLKGSGSPNQFRSRDAPWLVSDVPLVGDGVVSFLAHRRSSSTSLSPPKSNLPLNHEAPISDVEKQMHRDQSNNVSVETACLKRKKNTL